MRLVWAAVVAGLAGAPAAGFERLDGYLIAFEACEAFQSKNKRTNPGAVRTEPWRAYRMIAINAPGGDHFQVTVPGAPVTEQRWVHVDCGLHVVAAAAVPSGRPSESAANLLALSWQPAFCETRPGKPECVELNAGRLPGAERALSIHGLWPEPAGNVYCEVPAALVALDKASRWAELPEVELDEATRAQLAAAMPGTASFLERHEWIKHGTCHKGAGGADEYYDDTLRATAAVNAAVGELLAGRLGGEVTTAEIRAGFDAAFGAGAGERVQVLCADDGGRRLIQELRVALAGVIAPETPVEALILAAEPVLAGCSGGVVDAAGLQ